MGCGKERKMSYDLCLNSIQDGTIPLEEFLSVGKEDQTELVVLVSSTEGGTGSGSTPLLAKYIREVLGISVHVFLFIGFQEDVRGTKNTVEVFQELQNNFATEAVKLKKYLPECNNNRIKAEEKAEKKAAKKASSKKEETPMIQNQAASTTLGDIDALAALKQQLEGKK